LTRLLDHLRTTAEAAHTTATHLAAHTAQDDPTRHPRSREDQARVLRQ
jgi:hypothetical protein